MENLIEKIKSIVDEFEQIENIRQKEYEQIENIKRHGKGNS